MRIERMGYIALRTPRDIGLTLREARKRARLAQAELAARLGVSRKWVVDAERGNPGAGLGTVLRALEIVGVKIGIVVESSGDEDSPSAKRRAPTLRKPAEIDIDAIVEAARQRRR